MFCFFIFYLFVITGGACAYWGLVHKKGGRGLFYMKDKRFMIANQDLHFHFKSEKKRGTPPLRPSIIQSTRDTAPLILVQGTVLHLGHVFKLLFPELNVLA